MAAVVVAGWLVLDARWQIDLRPNMTLVGSALYRDESDQEARHGFTGVAFGIAPTSRWSFWAQADARFRQGESGEPGYTLVGDVAFEVYRGIWASVAPQLRTDIGDSSAGTLRMKLSVNWLARTHWNALIAYFHDRDRSSDRTSNTWLFQLHMYL